jgi:hypothetical protein
VKQVWAPTYGTTHSNITTLLKQLVKQPHALQPKLSNRSGVKQKFNRDCVQECGTV